MRNVLDFRSIQEAVDALPSGSVGSTHVGSILVPATDSGYMESVNLDIQGSLFHGSGINTKIYAKGAHTLHVTNSDNEIANLWIDQQDEDMDCWDAIFVDGTQESRLRNLDIDRFDRYGLHVNGNRNFGSDIQFQGAGVACMYLGPSADRCAFSNIEFEAPTAGSALLVEGSKNTIKNVTGVGSGETQGGHGLRIKGVGNTVSVNLRSFTGNAALVQGDKNVVELNVSDSVEEPEVVVEGRENYVTGVVDGDLVFTPASRNNRFIGKVTGGVIDNGHGNIVHS